MTKKLKHTKEMKDIVSTLERRGIELEFFTTDGHDLRVQLINDSAEVFPEPLSADGEDDIRTQISESLKCHGMSCIVAAASLFGEERARCVRDAVQAGLMMALLADVNEAIAHGETKQHKTTRPRKSAKR